MIIFVKPDLAAKFASPLASKVGHVPHRPNNVFAYQMSWPEGNGRSHAIDGPSPINDWNKKGLNIFHKI
jgi:hypothetical protein